MLQGDEVVLLSLSTLVYRSLTPLDGLTFDRRCVVEARSALHCHEKHMSGFQSGDILIMEEYVNW